MKIAIACAVVALAATLAAGAGATVECQGVKSCIDVPGPWVSVPASGEATFLLECPKRQGTVVGVDALASSSDIHVTFDGLLGGPVAPGKTTGSFEFFRAVSGHHKLGLFQPRIGCTPPPSGGAQTTAYQLSAPGPALDLAAATFPVAPGTVKHLTLGCPHGDSLVDSWDATAFPNPVSPQLATAIKVTRLQKGGQIGVTIVTSETLPSAVHAMVQVGVRCAT